MEVFDAIKTLLAVRDYQAKPIPDEVVKNIVEAARLTGSAMNRQQWDFVVVRQPATLQRLGQLATNGPYIGKAALAIAVVVQDSPLGYIDGTRATQDMMLAAWSAGVGSNWVGNVNQAPIKELLNIPQDRMVLTIIPFGYPAKRVSGGNKNRKALSDVAHAEKLGNAFTA
ncbi:MAG: nitroreductase family protein [Caldilineaceae bacterium]